MQRIGTCKLPFGEVAVGSPKWCCSAAVALRCVPTSNETKTKLFVQDGVINTAFFAAGVPVADSALMSDVVDVREVEKNGSPKVVIVSFADGTSEKAVLDANDTYSLEQGISICIAKKLLGKNTSYGGALYNKIVKRALDVMKENEEKKVAEQKAIVAAEEKAAKQIAKKKARREKYAAMEAERQIEIQKEAYLRAIREMREQDKVEISEAVDEFGKFIENIIEEVEKEAKEEEKKEAKPTEVEQTVSEMNAE